MNHKLPNTVFVAAIQDDMMIPLCVTKTRVICNNKICGIDTTFLKSVNHPPLEWVPQDYATEETNTNPLVQQSMNEI